MTYWPISAPSVFAASKHQLPPESLSTTTDDAVRSQSHRPPTQSNGRSAPTIQKHPTEKIREEIADSGTQQPSNNGQTDQDSSASGSEPYGNDDGRSLNNEDSGEIIGLCVTRSGAMFATISQTTLTIWQTKVWTQLMLEHQYA